MHVSWTQQQWLACRIWMKLQLCLLVLNAITYSHYSSLPATVLALSLVHLHNIHLLHACKLYMFRQKNQTMLGFIIVVDDEHHV